MSEHISVKTLDMISQCRRAPASCPEAWLVDENPQLDSLSSAQAWRFLLKNIA
jgi:hypothetical protein